MYVCIYICTYVHMCICVYMYLRINVCTIISIYENKTYIYICIYADTYSDAHAYTYRIDVYLCIYKYI